MVTDTLSKSVSQLFGSSQYLLHGGSEEHCSDIFLVLSPNLFLVSVVVQAGAPRSRVV